LVALFLLHRFSQTLLGSDGRFRFASSVATVFFESLNPNHFPRIEIPVHGVWIAPPHRLFLPSRLNLLLVLSKRSLCGILPEVLPFGVKKILLFPSKPSGAVAFYGRNFLRVSMATECRRDTFSEKADAPYTYFSGPYRSTFFSPPLLWSLDSSPPSRYSSFLPGFYF